ncbi:MAG: dTDP-glucose 4,6-dehydratase [Minisyncoccia bacterium]
MQNNFGQSRPNSIKEDDDFRKDLSNALAKKIDLLSDLYREKKITIDEIALILGIDRKEIESILNKKGLVKKKRILVGGGAGFIGSNFIYHILEKYPSYEVINYDVLTYAANIANLREASKNPNYTFIKGDIADYEKLEEIAKTGIDAIVNFAAETAVGRSVHGKAADFIHSNVVGTHTLLELAKNYKIPRYIQISTDEVYGTVGLDEDRTFFEDSPFMPNVPYAAAKAGGDLMCRAYYNTYKVPVIVTHCSNNYGPYQHPEKLIPYFIFRAMNNQSLPVHGDGRHVRDWIYVRDHCEAIDVILHRGTEGEVYNISADSEKPTIEIARLILELIGKPQSLINHVPDRPGNDRRYSISANKMGKEFSWKPSHTFEDAMPKTIQWYQHNIDWVEKIKDKDQDFTDYI